MRPTDNNRVIQAMENCKNDNNKTQNRREFFKEAVKKALPILGTVVLMSNPLIANVNGAISDCNSSCINTCKTTCEIMCGKSCIGYCRSGCDDSCAGTCKEGCAIGCKGSCSDNCVNTCLSSCKGSNEK